MYRRKLLFCIFLFIMSSLFAFQSRKKVQEVDDEALKRQQELLAQYEQVEADAAEELRQAELRKLEAARKEEERIKAEKLEQERKEQEAKEKALQEQLEKERLEKEKQENLEKQIELALEKEKQKSSETKKQKEYLSEYLLTDDYYIEEYIEPEEKIENPDATDSFGRTALMNYAKAGDVENIKRLLKFGANPNLIDNEGWTALMYAVRYSEKTEPVNLLIKAGSDIKKENKYGLTALSLAACYNNNAKILSTLLKQYKPSEKEVFRAFTFLLSEQNISEDTQISKTVIFLEAGIPVNVLYNGKTPLMYAAAYGNSTKVIKMLLDYQASVSVRSTEGKTAFDYAVQNYNLAHDQIYWSLNVK